MVRIIVVVSVVLCSFFVVALLALLSHEACHLLGFLLFLKLVVVFLPWTLSCLSDPLLLFELFLSLLLFHVLDGV